MPDMTLILRMPPVPIEFLRNKTDLFASLDTRDQTQHGFGQATYGAAHRMKKR